MKHLILFCVLSYKLFAQTLNYEQIKKYVSKIDSLKQHHQLKSYTNSVMSFCGGGVKGYYDHHQLVYINSTYSAELGYSSRIVYLKDSVPYKIIYREHFAEWDKHLKKYPNSNDQDIEKRMTYTDTVYTIILSKNTVVTKLSNHKVISHTINQELLKHLLECVQVMRLEIEKEKNGQKDQ